MAYFKLKNGDIISAEEAPKGATPLWGAVDAMEAWGIKRAMACRLMPRVPGYQNVIVNGRATHLVPADSPRPEKMKPGVKAGSNRSW